MVIDYLKDDLPMLKQCSLVSKSWALSSSKYLFIRVGWPKCPGYTGYKCINRRLLAYRCFPELLQSLGESNRVAPYVRALRLSQHSCCRDDAEGHPLPLDVLVSILSVMPRLHTLSLSNCQPIPSIHFSQAGAKRILSLHSLFILTSATKLQPLMDLLAWVGSASHISIIWVPSRVTADLLRTPSGYRPDQLMNVDSLELCTISPLVVANLILFLQRGVNFRALKRLLMLSPLDASLVDELQPLIAEGTLDTFAYIVNPHYTPSAFARPLRLTSLTLLAHIALDAHTPWALLLRDLACFRPDRLRTLELRLWVSTPNVEPVEHAARRLPQSAARFEWAQLGDTLAACPALECLIIRVSWDDDARPYPCPRTAVRIVRRAARTHLPRSVLESVRVAVPYAPGCAARSDSVFCPCTRTPLSGKRCRTWLENMFRFEGGFEYYGR